LSPFSLAFITRFFWFFCSFFPDPFCLKALAGYTFLFFSFPGVDGIGSPCFSVPPHHVTLDSYLPHPLLRGCMAADTYSSYCRPIEASFRLVFFIEESIYPELLLAGVRPFHGPIVVIKKFLQLWPFLRESPYFPWHFYARPSSLSAFSPCYPGLQTQHLFPWPCRVTRSVPTLSVNGLHKVTSPCSLLDKCPAVFPLRPRGVFLMGTSVLFPCGFCNFLRGGVKPGSQFSLLFPPSGLGYEKHTYLIDSRTSRAALVLVGLPPEAHEVFSKSLPCLFHSVFFFFKGAFVVLSVFPFLPTSRFSHPL